MLLNPAVWGLLRYQESTELAETVNVECPEWFSPFGLKLNHLERTRQLSDMPQLQIHDLPRAPLLDPRATRWAFIPSVGNADWSEETNVVAAIVIGSFTV